MAKKFFHSFHSLTLSRPTFPQAKVDFMQMFTNANVWRLAQASFAYGSTLSQWNRVTCWPWSGCQGNTPPTTQPPTHPKPNTHTHTHAQLPRTKTHKLSRTHTHTLLPWLQQCRSVLMCCTNSKLTTNNFISCSMWGPPPPSTFTTWHPTANMVLWSIRHRTTALMGCFCVHHSHLALLLKWK